MKKLTLTVTFTFILACQNKSDLSHYQWSVQGSQPRPELPPELMGKSETTVKIFDEIVERSTQRVGGAIVDGSHFNKISDTKGRLQFLKAQYDQKNYANLVLQAENLRFHRYSALEIVKRKNLDLQKASVLFEPEVILVGNTSEPRFQYQFEYIPQDGSGVFSMRVSPAFAIESISRVENCLDEIRSLVFPFGPRLSQLIEIILSPLLGDGSLASQRVSISSEDGQRATAENGGFIYDVEDPRFDQVQAFFFAQKTLKYAEENWDFSLPFPLKIGLRAGYPRKTNTAYYYRGLIRFGEGDGVGYKNIPRDPSIVTHEVAHAIIDSLSAMGTEGEAASINEGFADYLTASLWQNPELGHTAFLRRPYTRTVATTLGFNERNGGLYHDSGILSGTLWEIEKLIGASKTQKLALKSIARLGAVPHFIDVHNALVDAMKAASFDENEEASVLKVLSTRAWPASAQ